MTKNTSARASALQITLSVVLLSVSAILFASNFKAAASGPMITVPQGPITVSLPIDTLNTSVPITTVIIEPVSTAPINASFLLVGFKGDFRYDPSVVDFSPQFVRGAGLTLTNWQFSANIIPGPGPNKTLSISAFSNDATPLTGSGTLFELTMLRVSVLPGDLSSLVWADPPDDFFFVDVNGNPHRPTQTTETNQPSGLITIAAAPPTPTPGTVSISGTISYCSNPALPPVPDATLNLTPGTPATSDGSGYYEFLSLPAGNYAVTPSKAARAPSSAGIDTADAIATQRHFLNIGPLLSGCRLTAADVNGSGGVTTTDVIAIQRFFLGLSTGIANTGKYQFNPLNRTYTQLTSNQTGQNYDTLVFGDVASPFVP